MRQPYPAADDFAADDTAETELGWIQQFVLGIRQIRGEMDIAPGKVLPVLLQDAGADDLRLLDIHERYLLNLARLESLTILQAGEESPPAATALLGQMKILVPMAGLIDVSAERQRLTKNRERLEKGLKSVAGKLANEKFLANAPADVVVKEREKQAGFQQEIDQIGAQLERLEALE